MDKLSVADKLILIITTVFGVGYTPLMPGTAASIAGVACYLVIRNPMHFFIFTVLSIIAAYVFSSRAEAIYAKKDCKKIVIDDFSGMCLSLIFIPRVPMLIFMGFWLFRGFDMVKIFPANRIEDLPGARGIVGDDLIAGLYANIFLQVLKFSFNIAS